MTYFTVQWLYVASKYPLCVGNGPPCSGWLRGRDRELPRAMWSGGVRWSSTGRRNASYRFLQVRSYQTTKINCASRSLVRLLLLHLTIPVAQPKTKPWSEANTCVRLLQSLCNKTYFYVLMWLWFKMVQSVYMLQIRN